MIIMPMVMAMPNAFNPNTSPLEKEISGFFTFRAGQPGYVVDKTTNSEWGWLSMFPQAIYYKDNSDRKNGVVEQMTVGIAMNHDYENKALAAMSGNNIAGRSYTSEYKDRYVKEGAEASKWGYNFAEQFKFALETDPKMIFITGWNEWAMARIDGWPSGWDSEVPNAFCDQFNDEFSRDLEPTKGELKDHYYYQLVNLVRKYKGVRPIPAPGAAATIDITKDNAQWNEVGPYYAAYIGGTENRDTEGAGDVRYTEYSGRNDIIGARVARDGENVYFYVECFENITPYTDPLWMNLYIDANQENQGWESFDFVLNKTAPTADKATLERFTGNGYETETVGEVEYTVNGKYMQVKIPKAMIGFGDTIDFKWADNPQDLKDPISLCLHGDTAPNRRFNYRFIWKK